MQGDVEERGVGGETESDVEETVGGRGEEPDGEDTVPVLGGWQDKRSVEIDNLAQRGGGEQ